MKHKYLHWIILAVVGIIIALLLWVLLPVPVTGSSSGNTSDNVTGTDPVVGKGGGIGGFLLGGGDCGTEYESYKVNDDGYGDIYALRRYGQRFTPEQSHTLTCIDLKIYRVGTPGTFYVYVYETDGV